MWFQIRSSDWIHAAWKRRSTLATRSRVSRCSKTRCGTTTIRLPDSRVRSAAVKSSPPPKLLRRPGQKPKRQSRSRSLLKSIPFRSRQRNPTKRPSRKKSKSPSRSRKPGAGRKKLPIPDPIPTPSKIWAMSRFRLVRSLFRMKLLHPPRTIPSRSHPRAASGSFHSIRSSGARWRRKPHKEHVVPYRKMVVVNDAVSTIQKGRRGARQRMRSYEGLGQCVMERAKYYVTSTVRSPGVREPGLEEKALRAALYLVGYAAE